FLAGAPVRGFPVLARDHATPAVGATEETGSVRHPSPRPLFRSAEALRVHPDAKGPRSLSGDHGNGALGRHPHGGRARAPTAPRAQDLRQVVRSGDGVLGMRRGVARQAGARACRAGSGRLQRTREGALSSIGRMTVAIGIISTARSERRMTLNASWSNT